MGLGPPLFFWWGLATPLLNYEFCPNYLSNTNSIWSIVKVNRLMKKICRFLPVCSAMISLWWADKRVRQILFVECLLLRVHWLLFEESCAVGALAWFGAHSDPGGSLGQSWSVLSKCTLRFSWIKPKFRLCKSLFISQYFGINISNILFVIWQEFVNVCQNTPRTIWSTFSRLLTILV